MAYEKDKKTKLITRLRNRYRLTIMNDDTFEEKFTLRLTPLGVVIMIGSITIVMTILVISLIAFTPLREYIPGYADVNMRRQMIKLALRSDSLQQTMSDQDAFIKNIGNVLNDKVGNDSTAKKPTKKINPANVKTAASPSENALRKDIEAQD